MCLNNSSTGHVQSPPLAMFPGRDSKVCRHYSFSPCNYSQCCFNGLYLLFVFLNKCRCLSVPFINQRSPSYTCVTEIWDEKTTVWDKIRSLILYLEVCKALPLSTPFSLCMNPCRFWTSFAREPDFQLGLSRQIEQTPWDE